MTTRKTGKTNLTTASTTSRRSAMNTNTRTKRGARRNLGRWTLATAVLSLLGACAGDMDPASLVEKTRVLGARVQVEGAPERATPRPGETAQVSWIVTAPAELPPLGWAFALCASAGDQGCAQEPLAVWQGHDAQPVVTVTIPDAATLAGARSLSLYGRICSSSEPTLDAATGRPGCTMSGDGTTALVTIAIAAGDDDVNHNPDLADHTLWLDGKPWTTAGEDCASLPQVKAGSHEHLLRLETMGTDREAFTLMEGDPPRPTQKREALQISQFTTAGKLERSVSAVEGDDASDRPRVEVKWDAPDADKVAAGGQVVRFTFVARDMRGGVDWTRRTACVVK
jgi:hypothetical protein